MLRHEDLFYRVDVDKLLLGGTYTNETIFVRLLADSSLAGLWCARDDEQYCGKWRMHFSINGERVPPSYTEFAPEYQRTVHTLGDISLAKRVFVPITGERPDIVFVILEVYNGSGETVRLVISSEMKYPEVGWVEFVKHPDPNQRRKRVVTEQSPTLLLTRTVGRDDEVRVIAGGLAIAHFANDSISSTCDFEPVNLLPGETRTIPFALAISPYGAEDALLTVAQIEHHDAMFRETQAAMREMVMDTLQVATPDAMINRAIAWAKVNTFRQRNKYPTGYGFTNDPPQDVVVVRDAAWFALGADYFLPDFSADMLRLVGEFGVEEGGKLTEYLLCCETPPYRNDYDLNINDDTPLYILAVHHHYAVTGDRAFLDKLYPVASQAAEWILMQRDEKGLVVCRSDEANVWGICSWRNIIPGYSINGAVTEINSECYRALHCARELAEVMGDLDRAAAFAEGALQLRESINRYLRSMKTGYYLLNLDVQGVEHHDITGDLVFPIMFGVADEPLERRILDILHTPMLWTEHGSRTVAVGEHNYDPEFGIRLVGGIWPNLTVWVSYANRKVYPERLVEGMRAAYRICEVDDPKKYKNLVPGEFPECLHGENFESRGMALSPWMPPTYLWLAVEGLLGIEPGISGFTARPNIPADWNWIAARNIPGRGGKTFSVIYHDEVLYSTGELSASGRLEIFDEEVTDRLTCNSFAIGFKRDGELIILVASESLRNVDLTVPAEITGEKEARSLSFRLKAGEARLVRWAKGDWA